MDKWRGTKGVIREMGRGAGRLGVALIAVVLILPQSVLAQNWPTAYQNNRRNAVVNGAGIGQAIVPQWDKTPTSPYVNFKMPLYQDGIFYFFEHNWSSAIWSAYATEKGSGRQLWRTSGSGVLNFDPVVSGNYLVLPCAKLTVLNAQTGAIIWQYSNDPNYYFWYPLVFENTVYTFRLHKYGGTSGDLYAFDLVSGALKWQKAYGFSNLIHLSAYHGNLIVTSSTARSQSYLTSVKMSDGTQNWSTPYFTYNPSGPVAVDEVNGLGLLANVGGQVRTFNLETGESKSVVGNGSGATVPLLQNNCAYFFTLSGDNKTYLNSFDYVADSPLQKTVISETSQSSAATRPLIGNGRFYLPTTAGELWRFDQDGSNLEKFTVAGGSYLTFLMLADDEFILANSALNHLYVTSEGPVQLAATSEVTLESPYKSDGEYHEYLGQTHSHWKPDAEKWSKIWNGEPTPAFTENLYKDAGYDFVSLTEHNELTANPNVGGILHIADAEEDTQGKGGNHILSLGIHETIDEGKSNQERIDQVTNQGGVALLSHPNSKEYPWSLKNLLETNDYSGIEIFNGSANRLNRVYIFGNGTATDKWDEILTTHKQVWGSGGDDYTPGEAANDRAAIVVRAKGLTQSDILNNVRQGNFYAVQGSEAPRLNIMTSGAEITVVSSQKGTIRFIGKDGREFGKNSETFSATYTAGGGEIYIRAEVEADGRKAWSQPIWVNNKSDANTSSPGQYLINLPQASLQSSNTAGVEAKTLPAAEYPSQAPSLGYLSPVYSFSTTGQVQVGTELSVSYTDQDLLTNENNLSLYTYDSSLSRWLKVPSIIDTANKVVKAALAHFSLYTLSAETPADTTAPAVSLLTPVVLNDLAGNVNFAVQATDDNGVVSQGVFVDDSPIAESAWSSEDEFGLDMNSLPDGSHTLKLTAEDFIGNLGQAEYQFSVKNSTFTLPQITLVQPAAGDNLVGTSLVSGTFSSQFGVDTINISLDGVQLGEAEIASGTFTKEFDWSQFKFGQHSLKVELTDANGNAAAVERTVTLGVKAEIISPQETTYLHAQNISINFNSQTANLVAKIDGQVVGNHSTFMAYNLPLGNHTFAVEYNGTVIAQSSFTVSTSLADQKNLANKFWHKGEIKGSSTYHKIDNLLDKAIRFEKNSDHKKTKSTINELISLINKESSSRKPDISNTASITMLRDLQYLAKGN